MSPRSLCLSFSKALIAVTLCGCADLIDGSGSSDNNSKSVCSGEGGLFPTPVGPQSFQKLEKFSLPEKVFRKSSLPANTPLVAVVNEKCIQAQAAGSRFLTQNLRPQIDAQPALAESRAYSLKIPSTHSQSEITKLIEQDPCLLQLSEDSEMTLSATVNDPQLNLQLHLDNIDAFVAWDTLHAGLTGNTVIAIIDDGMQMNHPDLAGALWTNSGEIASNGIDDDGNGYVDDVNGYNFVSSLGSPAHEGAAYHGTHVAGLAAALGDNGAGVTGVMGRNAQIMVLNVFGPNASTGSANIVNAINYARNKGADVINMSLGGSGTASSVNTAMINAVAAGSFIAVAAGNDNVMVSAAGFYMPMGYAKDIDGAMAVGSIDAVSSLKSSFSNYSTTYVEIAAPGSNQATAGVRSTYTASGYAYLQGTSMASPVLAGGAALLMGWAVSQGKTATPAQVETLLKASVTSSSALTPYFLNGGQLNLSALADLALCNL